VQVNAPDVSDVKDPLVQLEMVTLSKTRDVNGVATEKPVPATITVAPCGPLPGVTVIAGTVTLNAPVAAWPPPSVAVTVVPDVPLGTAKVQLNVPVPLVVNEPVPQLEIVTESNTSEVSGVETEKPVPATVTDAPFGP
jgi:hypothetical protein